MQVQKHKVHKLYAKNNSKKLFSKDPRYRLYIVPPSLLKVLFMMSYGWSAEGKGDLGRAREKFSEPTPVLVIMCETLYIRTWLSEN